MSPMRNPSPQAQSLRGQNHGEAGFTLVELMVSLVVSSVVVFFLFSIQTKMSSAFQGQSTVSEINQNQQAAKQLLVRDIQMAGFGLANDGIIAVADTVHASGTLSGFVVNNNAYDGNDSFQTFYANSDDQVLIDTFSGDNAHSPDTLPTYAINEPVILSTRNEACLVAVTGHTVNDLEFNPIAALPYNVAPSGSLPANPHCDAVQLGLAALEPVTLRRLVARAYRIDPSRANVGYLQQSPSGGIVAGDWVDMGVGFTNLQIASRYFEENDLIDRDGDGDPERDWYSSDNQETPDLTASRPGNARLTTATLSIEGRSPRGTRGGAASEVTPAFIDISNPSYNNLGDWGTSCPMPNPICGVDLKNTPNSGRLDRYKGEYIYRHNTARIDLRNMGVGL